MIRMIKKFAFMVIDWLLPLEQAHGCKKPLVSCCSAACICTEIYSLSHVKVITETELICLMSDISSHQPASYKGNQYNLAQREHLHVVSCEKVPNSLSRCHTKRRMGVQARAHPSFGMTPTFPKKRKSKQIWHFFFFNSKENRKSRCPTKTRAARTIVHLLVWQQLRPLGSFWQNAAQCGNQYI